MKYEDAGREYKVEEVFVSKKKVVRYVRKKKGSGPLQEHVFLGFLFFLFIFFSLPEN